MKLQVFRNYLFANFYLQIKILNRVYVLSFIKLQLVKILFTVTTSPGAPSLKDFLQGFFYSGKILILNAILFFKSVTKIGWCMVHQPFWITCVELQNHMQLKNFRFMERQLSLHGATIFQSIICELLRIKLGESWV